MWKTRTYHDHTVCHTEYRYWIVNTLTQSLSSGYSIANVEKGPDLQAVASCRQIYYRSYSAQ
jgi:hypothetical protein